MATDSKNSNIYLKASTNFKDVAGQINNGLKDIRTSALSTATKFAGIVTAITGIGVSFLSIKKLFDNGLTIQTNFEDAQNDISGMIGSVYKMVDANGKLLEGQEKYTLAIRESKKVLEQFGKDAFKFNIKPEDLAGSFKDAIYAANNAGVNSDGLQNLITEVSKLYKSQGQDTAAVGKDLSDVLNGKVKENSVLGKALNLGNSDAYKKALETNKVMEYILSNVEKTAKGSEVIDDNLGDALSKIKRNFDVISKSVVTELSKQLKEISDNFSGMFSEEGVPNDGLKVVIANLAYIGGLVGVVIKKAFESLAEMITGISQNTNGLVSFIDMAALGLSAMSEVVSTVYNGFARVFNTVLSVAEGIGETTSKTEGLNEELDKQKANTSGMKFLISGFAAVKIALNAILGLFVVLFNTIRSLGAFMYGALVQPFIYMYDLGKKFINLFKENKDDAQDLNKEYEESVRLLKEQQKAINGADNGMGGAFGYSNKTGNQEITDAFRPLQEGVESDYNKFINVGGLNSKDKSTRDSSRNALGLITEGEITEQTDKLKKTLQEIKTNAEKLKNERDGAIKTAIPADGGGTVATPNNLFAIDALKKSLDDQLKSLQTSSANDKNLFAEKDRYAELYFSNNLISYKKYYEEKGNIEKEDYNKTLANMKSQLSILEQQRNVELKLQGEGAKYDDKNLSTLNDKIIQQQNDINSLTRDFGFNSKKSFFDAANATKEYENAVDDLKIKVLELDGLTKDAKKLTLDVEIRGLRDKNQSNPEMLKLVDDFAKSTEFKNKVDDLNDTISDIFTKNENAENKQDILLNKGKISQLDYYNSISKSRRKAYDELLKQQSDLESVYNSTKDPKILNDLDAVNNKILEVSLSLTPLADHFNEVFKNNLGTLFDDLTDTTTTIPEAFKKMFQGIEKEVQSFASKELAQTITNSLFKDSGSGSGGGFGGMIASLFSSSASSGGGSSSAGFFTSLLGMFGGNATGGNIGRNGISVVGENGPELIQSRENATIYSADKTRQMLGGSRGGVYNLNINLQTKDATSFRNNQNQIMSEASTAMRKMSKYD